MFRVSRLISAFALLGATIVGCGSAIADGFDRGRGGHSRHAQSWSGLYGGVNAGGAWGDLKWDSVDFNESVNRSISGGIFGLHLGIQQQWGSLVLGLEASYSGALGGDIDGRGPDIPTWAATFDNYARVNSIYTIGPRVGWALSRHWLIYGTGGFASASVYTTDMLNTSNSALSPDRLRHNGWFLGTGVEYALTRNWILGVEYLHLELGEKLHSPNDYPRRIDGDVDILRGRLSFKFGDDGGVIPSMK